MSRVASCPKCDHEFLVPGEAEGEAWAKCPDCRAFFQVKEASARDLPALLLVDQHELPPTDDLELDAGETESQAALANADAQDDWNAPTSNENDQLDIDDLDLDDLNDEPKPGEDLEIDGLNEQPKSSDELEAAAQRIDEWFRSAKTVPDAPPIGDDTAMLGPESDALDDEVLDIESHDDSVPLSSARNNATIDLDEDRVDELANMADFDLDLGDADEPKAATAAWDDSERMENLFADIDTPSTNQFDATETDADQADVNELAQESDERPAINMFADDAAPEVNAAAGRNPRRKRSLARSLIMITAAGVFGLAAGYYVLLWLRGPEIDFLNVAQYLPAAMLPASFDQPKQPAPIAPSASVATTEEEAATPETPAEDTTPLEEPQELAPVAEDSTEIAAAESTPSDVVVSDTAAPPERAEVQAGYTETEPATDEPGATPAVGDRYADAANSAAPGDDTTSTDVTAEKPETDVTVEELAATETPADPAAANDPTAPQQEVTQQVDDSETAAAESSTDSLFGETESSQEPTTVRPIKIAGTPTFTTENLRGALQAATAAQPQLVAGNFTDGKEVQKKKGYAFSMLAELAQQATFVDRSDRSSAALEEEADALFKSTLADAHTRGEVAQILPRWIASKNRKHGGVFFAGRVTGQQEAGSVVECKVELDGGQSATILMPKEAAANIAADKPAAIVGWIVDAPKSKVDGYTGAEQQAIWTTKLIPLE